MKHNINKVLIIGILIMLFYSHADNIYPFQPYNKAMEEKIEQYRDFVFPYRGDDTESFLTQIYGLSTQYGLNFDIVMRWLYTESRFYPKAISPKGAVGICQLMPPTAQLIADVIKYPRYNLLNEDDNLILGFAFLSLLLRESDYDYEKALARYYAGSYWNYYLDSRYVRFIVTKDI